jgi:GH15 family glucan-1,4-alpha-glucosidase
MCWVALDRAIALAGQLGAEDRVHGWAAARGELRAAIAERGWTSGPAPSPGRSAARISTPLP